MLSYHNDAAVKAKYVARFAAHRAADEVIQGTGFANGRGCFVGCTLDDYNHAQFPVELGWPEWLARLADAIFEGVPRFEAAQFGTDLLDSVPVGVDLEPLRYRFPLTVQQRNLARLAGNAKPYAVECRAAIEGVIAYLKSEEKTESAAWSAARSAARSAAWSAESAAWSAARAAAWSAAWSTESAAESAAWSAWSAARSAAWSAESAAGSAARLAARSAEFQTQRNDLLAMLREME